jgi:outer membrane protein TolC
MGRLDASPVEESKGSCIKMMVPRGTLFLFLLVFLSSFAPLCAAEEILTWGTCVKEAAKNHPDLIFAEEAVHQEVAAKAIAASGLYPQVSASLDVGTVNTNGKSTKDYAYGASATQLVFDGFKTVHNVGAASENIIAARQSYRFASSQVRLDLRTAFISLLRAQEMIKVTSEIVKIRRDNLVLIALRYQSGLEHKGALLTAEANLAQARFDFAQSVRNVIFAQKKLTKEMGRREFHPMIVDGDFTVRDDAKIKPDFEVIIAKNPTLLRAAAEKNAASFGIKSAYANFAPLFSGTASADRNGATWPPDESRWTMGLVLTLPLFEGGLRHAQLAQAKAVYRQAEADERSARDSAVVALEQNWAALRDAVETVSVQRKTLDAARERSHIAQAQYSIGMIAYDNWTIIEDALVRAKSALLDAEANALLAEARWIQAKGETLEYEK